MASVEDIETPVLEQRVAFLENRLAHAIDEQRLLLGLLKGLAEIHDVKLESKPIGDGKVMHRWIHMGRIVLP